MTEVRVLPIRHGEAVLLRSGRGGYLLDGGGPGQGMVTMLRDRGVRRLRGVVCTAPTADRAGGILELLESAFPVAEYWFPAGLEILPELARRFDGDWDGWLRAARGEDGGPAEPVTAWGVVEMLPPAAPRRRMEGAAMLAGLALTACLGWSPYDSLSRESLFDGSGSGCDRFFAWTIELLADRGAASRGADPDGEPSTLHTMGERLCRDHGGRDLGLLAARMLLAEAEDNGQGMSRATAALVRTMALAAALSVLLAGHESRIRFFRPTGRVEAELVPRHPFRCLNGTEVRPLEGLPAATTAKRLAGFARAMTGSGSSLVFQYGERAHSVLLCSENRLRFVDRDTSIRLDRPTVVVAPRQGGTSAQEAYARIRSTLPEMDIWVRGFRPAARKAAPSFEDKVSTRCLNDCRTRTVQEILLAARGDGWAVLSGGRCGRSRQGSNGEPG